MFLFEKERKKILLFIIIYGKSIFKSMLYYSFDRPTGKFVRSVIKYNRKKVYLYPSLFLRFFRNICSEVFSVINYLL